MDLRGTQHVVVTNRSGYWTDGKGMDFLHEVQKVRCIMNISDFDLRTQPRVTQKTEEVLQATFDAEGERFADELMESMTASPIGKLLSIISALPEIRQEKVTNARRQIELEAYDLDNSLGTAIDMMIEELMA